MKRILVIKTGAAGDIVRTTTLLRVLTGHVTWVTDARYRSILPPDHPNLQRILTLQEAWQQLPQESFDLVLSLEEDLDCARLASQINTAQLIGVYIQNEAITYTETAAGWYDMSLISKYGPAEANARKAANPHTFQHWLFNMLSLPFRGEQYCIYTHPGISPRPNLVGIETRSGDRWPNKAWTGYDLLTQQLLDAGFEVLQLSQRDTLQEYMEDIARCKVLVSGDTLAMHLAMAYHIPAVAIFNCTSPQEIYDYGILKKVINPLWKQAFYGRTYQPEIVGHISPSAVFNSVQEQMTTISKGLTQKA